MGLTEFIIDQQAYQLAGNSADLKQLYDNLRNFSQRVDFWQDQAELKLNDSLRSTTLAFIRRMRDLGSQRHQVIHRLWGGGIQAGSWSAEHYPTTDASLMKDNTDAVSPHTDGRAMLRWRLTFTRLKQMAREMATLNRDMMLTLIPGPEGPPLHSNVGV